MQIFASAGILPSLLSSGLSCGMISDRESDIDVLVNLRSGTSHRISSILHMEKELGGILGREVDLVFRSDVERSRNYLRREAVLKSAEVFYEAR